jgi:hypothetical protein
MLLTEEFLGWVFFWFGSTSILSTVVTGQTEGLKIGCGGMGSKWLSRFKLIRLRRISLATLPRYGRMGGRRNGYQYIYCLHLAGGLIRSQGNYCLPPAGVLHSQNKVIKCAAYGVAQGRGAGLALL